VTVWSLNPRHIETCDDTQKCSMVDYRHLHQVRYIIYVLVGQAAPSRLIYFVCPNWPTTCRHSNADWGLSAAGLMIRCLSASGRPIGQFFPFSRLGHPSKPAKVGLELIPPVFRGEKLREHVLGLFFYWDKTSTLYIYNRITAGWVPNYPIVKINLYTTPEKAITGGSKPPFTGGF
jgi:hypothetical protein